MSESLYWDDVKKILQLFYPQYFNPADPSYVDPILLNDLLLISDGSRPWCLSIDRQNFAQAMFTAHLISVHKETSTGHQITVTAGPVTSEKEGDIMMTYAMSPGGTTQMSKRPSSDPWDAWNRLWQTCAKGSITSRFGDPLRPVGSIY